MQKFSGTVSHLVQRYSQNLSTTCAFYKKTFTLRSRCLSSNVLPDLTKDRYPHIKRGNYKIIDDNDCSFFRNLLGDNRVLTDLSDCEMYNIDWIKSLRGHSKCVLKPKTTEEVLQILRYCNEQHLAVCPQGGNTGLVGGSVPVFDEIVLSLSLMNRTISIDSTSGILLCEAGCILQALDEELSHYGLMMPLDLGAKGSCQIGGNVATNAGGLRMLRYGNLQGNVLGIKAVTARGEIIDCLNTLKKDNTGYHLKHLFIGSEGTLGVVTEVAIQCPPKPAAVNVAFLGVKRFDTVLSIFNHAKRELGEIMSSFEMMDEDALGAVLEHVQLKLPLTDTYPFYVLVETHGNNVAHDEEKVYQFLGNLMDRELSPNGTIATEPSKIRAIWELRERIPEAILHDGYVFKYDLSLPLEKFYTVVQAMKERLGGDIVRCCGYGHIGDGNIHLNISLSEYNEAIKKRIEPYIFEYVSQLKGSISAEHGIGFAKPKYLHYSKSSSAIELMKQLKDLMDPTCILNPYKVLP